MQLSLADILDRHLPVTPAEGAGLVLSVMDALAPRPERLPPDGLPPPDGILLMADGRVHLVSRDAAVCDTEPLHQLALLLGRFIDPGDPRHRPVPPAPGSLLLLIARATRQIDLPPPSDREFRATIARTGAADRTALAGLWRRCVHGAEGGEATTSAIRRAVVVPIRDLMDAHPSQPPFRNRRHSGPTGGDLRRDLREADLQLFELGRRHARLRSHAGVASATAAAVLLVASGLLFTSAAERPTPPAIAPVQDGVTATSAQQPSDGAQASRAAPNGTNVPTPAPRSNGDRESPAVTATAVPSPLATADLGPSPLLQAAAVGTDVFSPSFTHGGNELLFHAGRERGALMRASFDDRGQPRVAPLLQDAAANYHATLSPDGSQLAYDSDRDGTRGVYIARSDGSDVRRVSGEGYAAAPRWSPEGRRVAFVKAEAERPRVWNVWVLDLKTGARARISRHRVGQAWGPSWFPDGRHLAYSVEDSLVTVNVESGATSVLRSPVRGRAVRTPAVSPDGRWIVFQVYRDGVWLAEIASGTMRQVLADKTAEEFAWAPDGRHVVYHTRRQGTWSLWRLPINPAAIRSTS